MLFSDKYFWKMESGEQDKFSHLVLVTPRLLVSLEDLQNLMASLSQLSVVDALLILTYFMNLLSYLFSVPFSFVLVKTLHSASMTID